MTYVVNLPGDRLFYKNELNEYVVDYKILGRLLEDIPNTTGYKFELFASYADGILEKPTGFDEFNEFLGSIKDASNIKVIKNFYGTL